MYTGRLSARALMLTSLPVPIPVVVAVVSTLLTASASCEMQYELPSVTRLRGSWKCLMEDPPPTPLGDPPADVSDEICGCDCDSLAVFDILGDEDAEDAADVAPV